MIRLCLSCLLLASSVCLADKPQVIDVRAQCDANRACSFSVTLKHGDEGWQHYANRWDVLDADKKILASRTLRHPHVDEQPFTRSLSRVPVPASLQSVFIRAYDSKHGVAINDYRVELPRNNPQH